jgi:probable phosphoglycerate mutase
VPTTRLIILRHGETEWNAESRYQGQLDSPLTAAGRAQAEALGGRLAGENVSALYSSDLGRARQTAEAIASRTRHAIVHHVGLRERHLGLFQGHIIQQAREQWPEEYRRLRSGQADYTPPGGESQRALSDRVVAAVTEIAGRHPGETLAVVTHGGVLTALFRHVLGLPLDAPRRFARSNASWNVFTLSDAKWVMETWGDTSHLGGRLTTDD